jgi:TonB family protein
VRAEKRTIEKSIQGKPFILIGFFALSIASHGLLFLFHVNSQSKLVHTSIGSQKLSVTLSIADRKTKEQKIFTRKNTPQRPAHKLVKQTAKIASIRQNSTSTIAPTITATPTQKTISTSTLKVAQRNFLLGEIQNRLSQYLSYPTRAQRLGWQGEVMVGFHVDNRGFLHNIHLTQTSGYYLLDNATLGAIGKVKNIPLSLWFKNNQDNEFHPTALQLPVKYQLTNS